MRPGKSGQPGKNGKAGKAGTGNETGDFGGTGQVRYVVVEKGEGDVRNRNIIDCGLIPPQGQVCRWNARIVDDDGILEPGEELYLENFEIFNDGKDRPMLTLPSNSDIRMTFPNGGMELLDPNALHYINEPIEPGDRREVNTKIGLKVPVPPAPTKPGSYVSFPEMVGQVGMLCWESSSTYSEVLKVRWPVVLSDMECPPQLSRGEKEMLKFSVKNLSHKDIEKGLLCYRVVLKTPGLMKFAANAQAHVATIPVNSQASFEIEIEIEPSAPLFKRTVYHVELWYKKQLIEFATFKTRVTPIYDPKANTDIVLFSNKHQSYGEMCMWFRLLSSFLLSVQFWDLEKYGGLSAKAQKSNGRVKPHNLDWADGNNHGKLLVLPLSSQRDLLTLEGGNFIDHFQGKKNPDEGGCLFTGVESIQIVKSIFRTTKESWDKTPVPLKFKLRPKKIAEKKASLTKKYNQNNPNFFHIVEIIPIEAFKNMEQYDDFVKSGAITAPTNKKEEKKITAYALVYRSPFTRNVRAVTMPSFRSFSQINSFFNFLEHPNFEANLGQDLAFPGASSFSSLVHALIFSLSMSTKLRIADLWRGQPQPQIREIPAYFHPADVTPLTMTRLARQKRVTREYTCNALDVVCMSILGELQFERYGVKQQRSSEIRAVAFAKAKMKKGVNEFPIDIFPSTYAFLEFLRKDPKIACHTSLAVRCYDIFKKVSYKAPSQLPWQYHKIFEARFQDGKVSVRGDSGLFMKSDKMIKTVKYRDALHTRKVELWDRNNLGRKDGGRAVCELMYQGKKFSKQMQNANAFDMSNLEEEEKKEKGKGKEKEKKEKEKEKENEEEEDMTEESEDESEGYFVEDDRDFDEMPEGWMFDDDESEKEVPIYCVRPTALLFETEVMPPPKEVMDANYSIMPKEVFYHPLSYGFGLGNFPDPPNYIRPFRGPPWIL